MLTARLLTPLRHLGDVLLAHLPGVLGRARRQVRARFALLIREGRSVGRDLDCGARGDDACGRCRAAGDGTRARLALHRIVPRAVVLHAGRGAGRVDARLGGVDDRLGGALHRVGLLRCQIRRLARGGRLRRGGLLARGWCRSRRLARCRRRDAYGRPALLAEPRAGLERRPACRAKTHLDSFPRNRAVWLRSRYRRCSPFLALATMTPMTPTAASAIPARKRMVAMTVKMEASGAP